MSFDPFEALTPEQQEMLGDFLADVKELEPLPAVAARVMAMAESTHFSAQNLADTIRADQALTVRILRLANSPLHGLPRRINTLRDAIVLLGFREVRALAVASCVIDVAEQPEYSFDYERFWISSFMTATCAQALSRVFDCESDEAFTAGIVHNIGRLAWAQFRPQWLEVSTALARTQNTSLHEAQRDFFGFTDAEIGAAVARHWNFPEPLCEAVEYHAGPRQEDQFAPSAVAVVVRRARRFVLAHRISDGFDRTDRSVSPEIDWSHPAVESELRAMGGVRGVLRYAQEFVEASDELQAVAK